MAGRPPELTNGLSTDNTNVDAGAAGGDDPWANDRFDYWGGTGRDQATAPTDLSSANLSFENEDLLMLSNKDVQKITACWAVANGMDANDPKSYQQLTQSADGQIAVGPFKLDAKTISDDWLNGIVNGDGLVDRGALENYVRQGKISAQTADAVSSPEFMQFMESLQSGQQPTPEQIARFLPPDLQQAIAGDLTNAMAAGLAMEGGNLDAGSVVANLQARRFLTPEELADSQNAQLIASTNSKFASIQDAPPSPPGPEQGNSTQGNVPPEPIPTNGETPGAALDPSAGAIQLNPNQGAVETNAGYTLPGTTYDASVNPPLAGQSLDERGRRLWRRPQK